MYYKVTKIPYFGDIFLMAIRCTNCSLKISDILAVREKGDMPEKHEIRILPERLGDLVVLSSGAKVEIPELEIELTIGLEMGGEITTVEGILLESIEFINSLLSSEDDAEKKKKLERIKQLLETEKNNPTGKLRLIVTDKNKRSAIIPIELWSKRVEEERLKALGLREELISKAKELGKQIVKERVKKREFSH